ncbi:hypothetical protein TNCV_4327831 [Trichonephila clavipes]|nr:hypothetical protein TNCV_4327831 [Trichonephila clavipes]
MENCSCNSYPETRGKIPNLRNPIDRYLYYRFLANWQRKLSLPDLMITWKMKISLFRSSTGSVLVSPPPINFFE